MSQPDVFTVDEDAAPILATDSDGRLYYDDKRTGLPALDRSYIAVAATAFRKGRDVALIYPSPPSYVQIPVLLAVGFQTRGKQPPALFVSNRSGIREQYFKLGLGPKHQVEGIKPDPLGDFTAPMVKTGDGSRLSHITGHKPRHWDPENPSSVSLIHTTFGKKIANTLSDDLPLSGFVLDFTTKLLDDQSTREAYRHLAEEREIPRIMVFDSPNHPYLEKLEKDNQERSVPVVFWGWSPSTLENSPEGLLQPIADLGGTWGNQTASDGGTLPSPFTDSLASLNNIRMGIDRSIISVSYGDLEKAAEETYRLIGEASRFPRGTDDEYSAESHDIIGDAYFLYMYLDTFPTSVEFHDSLSALDDANSWGASNTLRGKVERLRSQRDVLERDVPGSGPMLGDACDALEQMIDLLTVHNPKADAIAEQIRKARASNDRITVLTATRKQESILRSFIAEKTEFSTRGDIEEDIKFHSLYNPHTVPDSDVLLFPGVPTRSHYPTVQTGAASKQQFLSYNWEVDRLKKRLEDITDTADWRTGPGMQKGAAKELHLGTDGLREYVPEEEAREPALQSYHSKSDGSGENKKSPVASQKQTSAGRKKSSADRIGASHTLSPEDISIDLGSLSTDQSTEDLWNEEFRHDEGEEKETIDAGRSSVSTDSTERSGHTNALRVDFADSDYMFEEPAGLVWALEDGNHSVTRERRSTASLEPGDRLLLIENDSRRDVFEHVVEKIHSECRGEFQQYLSMLDLWTTGVDHVLQFWKDVELAYNEDPTEPDVTLTHRKISELIAEDLDEWATEYEEPDATRGAQAIYQWIEKSSIGPSSPTPIKALGELYDVEVLKNHSKEIFKGLEEVRKLHIRIGNKLGKIVFSAHDADADEWLLEECGLRVSDVQDATVAKTVEKISSKTEEVDVSQIGKLQRRE